MELTDKELQRLTSGYNRDFQFSRILEKGIHAYNQAVDQLTDEEFGRMRYILKCIADQWNDKLTDDEKIESINSMRLNIESLGKSEHKAQIKDIFDSVSMPEIETFGFHPPHTMKSPRFYP